MRCYIKVPWNTTLKNGMISLIELYIKKDDDVDNIDFETYKYENFNKNNIDNKNCTLTDYHKVASVDPCEIHIENGFITPEPCEKIDEPTPSTKLSTILSLTNSKTRTENIKRMSKRQ